MVCLPQSVSEPQELSFATLSTLLLISLLESSLSPESSILVYVLRMSSNSTRRWTEERKNQLWWQERNRSKATPRSLDSPLPNRSDIDKTLPYPSFSCSSWFWGDTRRQGRLCLFLSSGRKLFSGLLRENHRQRMLKVCGFEAFLRCVQTLICCVECWFLAMKRLSWGWIPRKHWRCRELW